MKCESMRITRSKTPSLCSYNINSTSLNQVYTHKHLGVILSSDLSWKMHVLTVAAKANKILGLLKRTFGKCSAAIMTGYKTTVHPTIKYACPVWNPHQQYKLEQIQRNVSRWILGGSIEYNERLEYLGSPSLLSRRDFLSIVQLFKFINGFSKVNLHDYLQFSKGRTRSAHGYKIWTPYARTNIYKFSFWLRYINKWNDLPENLVRCNSVSKFKQGLKSYLYNVTQ